MMDVEPNCPVCKSQDKISALKLYQINFTTAVYLCTEPGCIYPKGYSWKYVTRNILDTENGESSDSDECDRDNYKTTSTISHSKADYFGSVLNHNLNSESDENRQSNIEDTKTIAPFVKEIAVNKGDEVDITIDENVNSCTSAIAYTNLEKTNVDEIGQRLYSNLECNKNPRSDLQNITKNAKNICLQKKISFTELQIGNDLTNTSSNILNELSKHNAKGAEVAKDNTSIKPVLSIDTIKNESSITKRNMQIKETPVRNEDTEDVFSKLENKLQTELGINIKISNNKSDSVNVNDMPIIFADSEEGKKLLNDSQTPEESGTSKDSIETPNGILTTPETEFVDMLENTSKKTEVLDISQLFNNKTNPTNVLKVVNFKQLSKCMLIPIKLNKPIRIINSNNKTLKRNENGNKNSIMFKNLPEKQNIISSKNIKIVKLNQPIDKIFNIKSLSPLKEKICRRSKKVPASLVQAASTFKPKESVDEEAELKPTSRITSHMKVTVENKYLTNSKKICARSLREASGLAIEDSKNDLPLKAKIDSNIEETSSQNNDVENNIINDSSNNVSDIGDIDINKLFDNMEGTAGSMQYTEELDDWLKSLI